jgi:hypothetical protein
MLGAGLRDAVSRPPGRALALIVAIWLLSTLLWFTPGLTRPDGVGYFVYLPSTWFDGDLLFFDEWAQTGLIRDRQLLFKDVTETQHLSNHWPAGASLAWYPVFIAADVVARATGAAGSGFSIPYVASIAFSSALCGLFVLLAGFRVARSFFGDGVAAAATIAMWFGSPLAWYALRHASMSHALSAAVCSGVVLLSLRLRDGVTLRRLFALGLAIGFACAVRPQNATIALVPFFVCDWRLLLRRSHALFLGALIAALPQFIVSTVLWGGPLVFVNIGGRAHSWQMFTRVRTMETLFSWYHGLATWTPLLVLAVIGLLLLHRHDRGLARAGLATFVAQLLLLSILERWFWGGASFGQRRFDSCTLFFLLGVAALLERLPRWIGAALTIVTTAWTMMLFIAATHLNLNRFQTPDELFAAFRLALADPTWHSFLGFTPPALRASVVLAAITTSIVGAVLMWIGKRAGVASATVYLLIMAAFYAWCGVHPQYDAVAATMIERHERGQLTSAAARDTIGLLRDEATYMRRVGRDAEADSALREAAAIRP